MAVQEQTPYVEYVANGVTTSFALGFDCDNRDHLIVLVDDVEPVVGAWSFSNGAVVFNTAPENGKKITIQRNTPFSRTTDYQSYNNSFRPPSVNKDFDWIWLKLQELGVADWILGNRIDDLESYVDSQDAQLQQNIDNLKNYVDLKDDELRAYLMEEIRKQGVALDQLDEYYNYLMQRLAQIAVDKGWEASFVVSAGGDNQQEINDRGGSYWREKLLGYDINSRVMLETGDIVRSTVAENTVNPNVDMMGWVKVSNTFSVLSITELMEIKGVKKGDVADVQSYYEPNYTLARPYFGGGKFVATQKAGLVSNLGTILPSQVSGIWWVRVDYDDVTPEFWGAYGDNSTDDTAKLQAAIDFAQVGVKISNKYKISDTLIVDGKHNFSLYGTGRNSWIRNLGAGKSAVRFINAEGCSLDNFGIIGDGVGFYSPTAQTLHGVEFQNSSLATLTNMVIKSHGGHGVYIHKGGWCFHLTNCKINFNKLDGINALPESNGSGSYFQNGNNLSLINTEINANGGNGVHWKAIALNINGGIIERSGASGVFIDNSAWAVSTWGVNITGVYFEANKDNCIRVLTASNAILDGMNVEGNFFGGGSPFPNNGTYIKFEGLYTGVRNSSIRANSMIQYGSNVFIDGGGTLDKSVRIETTYPTQNTLFAKIETGSKTRVINGALSTKSIQWASMVGDSDNFFSSTIQTVIYFVLPVDSETFIQSINFNIKTNTTSNYSITSSLISVNPSTGYETQLSNNVKNAPSGGDLNVQHDISQKGVSNPMYLKVTVPALATGSTAKISSPVLTFN